MQGIDWNALYQKRIQAPFIPRSIEDNYEAYRA